tara:strand:- start:116 stop:865 length:750 start_codon:yes stop_codon:yes gene_type:complete
MSVYRFYNKYGWKKNNKFSNDANLFEDLRKYSYEYVRNCRLRVLKFIPKKGKKILDFASGPIQYKEYLKYSKNFDKRYCVDFSKSAIKEAKNILGSKGKYFCDDFLKLKFNENYFDCSLSMHTIYHINKNDQKKVVKKLLKVTKKGKPVIIVYSNPNTLINKLTSFLKRKKKMKLYFFCHNIKWWYQFKNIADVKIYPWRSFSSQHQKILYPDNKLGSLMLRFTFKLENLFPDFFAKNFQYPIIVLTKH